jgi:hypothetical protein
MSVEGNSMVEEQIQRIIRQTDYTSEIALEQLTKYNFDEIATIKAYLGIVDKPVKKIQSINQEIYKQFREKFREIKEIEKDNKKIDI